MLLVLNPLVFPHLIFLSGRFSYSLFAFIIPRRTMIGMVLVIRGSWQRFSCCLLSVLPCVAFACSRDSHFLYCLFEYFPLGYQLLCRLEPRRYNGHSQTRVCSVWVGFALVLLYFAFLLFWDKKGVRVIKRGFASLWSNLGVG